MARWMTPTPEQELGLAAWVAERPPPVREILAKLDFYELFRMKSTGQRVILHSANENGTVTVNVLGRFNRVLFDRQVFGVNPDDLEPCELPNADEEVGALMELRIMVRPDQWELDADGKAVRRKS